MAVTAIFAFVTAIVPKWRRFAFWKGSNVRCGPIASLGFGIVYGTLAVFLFAEDSIAVRHRIWLVSLLLAGLIMVFLGQTADFKRQRQKQKRKRRAVQS